MSTVLIDRIIIKPIGGVVCAPSEQQRRPICNIEVCLQGGKIDLEIEDEDCSDLATLEWLMKVTVDTAASGTFHLRVRLFR